MQIGSLPPGFTTSVNGQQGAPPPPVQQSVSWPHKDKDKDGDHDTSAIGNPDSTTGKQVNVVT